MCAMKRCGVCRRCRGTSHRIPRRLRSELRPGNLHLINGLFDCHRSRVPVLAIAAHIPSSEIGTNYFQETHPQNLFKECSDYCEMVGIPEQMPRVLEIAMRTAINMSGVAVIVLPGDVLLHNAPDDHSILPMKMAKPLIRPNDEELREAAAILNAGKKVTILAGLVARTLTRN